MRGRSDAEKEKGPAPFWERAFLEAGWTGLEPAASGVTGRRYNQLNYHPKINQNLFDYFTTFSSNPPNIVGGTGIEPATTGV